MLLKTVSFPASLPRRGVCGVGQMAALPFSLLYGTDARGRVGPCGMALLGVGALRRLRELVLPDSQPLHPCKKRPALIPRARETENSWMP